MASAVKEELTKAMTGFGYEIIQARLTPHLLAPCAPPGLCSMHADSVIKDEVLVFLVGSPSSLYPTQALVTDIVPDVNVRNAMNEINASQRLRCGVVIEIGCLTCDSVLVSSHGVQTPHAPACCLATASYGCQWVSFPCAASQYIAMHCREYIQSVFKRDQGNNACRMAAVEKAEGQKVTLVKAAEADAEAKFLAGQVREGQNSNPSLNALHDMRLGSGQNLPKSAGSVRSHICCRVHWVWMRRKQQRSLC